MCNKRWYHWLTFVVIAVVAITIGLLNFAMGASIDSPYFAADDLFVRAIGLGFIVSAVLMLLQRRIGCLAAGACFLLSGIEVVVVWALGQPVANMSVLVVCAAFILLAGLAIWCGKVFTST